MTSKHVGAYVFFKKLLFVPLTIALLNLPKGKSLGRSKPATKHKHSNTLFGMFLLYPSLTELPSIEIK